MPASELTKMSGITTHVVRLYTRLDLLRPGCNLNPALSGAAIVALGVATVGAPSNLLFCAVIMDVPAENAGVFTLNGLLVDWLVWGKRFGMISLLGAAVVVTAGILVMREPDMTVKEL